MFYIPYYSMDWDVIFHQAFESEFGELPEPVQDEPLAHARVALDVWTSTKEDDDGDHTEDDDGSAPG